MFQNRTLALAALIFASWIAAYAAPAQASEPESNLSLALSTPPALLPVDPPAVNLAAVDTANLPSASLPDDPSVAPDQSTTSQNSAATPAQSQATSAQSPSNSAPLSSEEQLKLQERQRVFGVMAAFNTTVNRDALPLSTGQKFQLFFKSQTDPWPFGLAIVIAGINQADDSPVEYGQGMQGYAKRFGATYSDAFIGNFFGNAVLPSLWHEDPRYFQKGTGSFGSRFLWASTSTVWCRRDNGTWGPNYSNVAGNLIGAAIANVYYPTSERTAADTITRGLTVTAEGIIGAEVIEFWPDMVRHYRRKQAEKLAKQTARQDAQDAQAAQKAAPQTSTSAPAADPPRQ